MSKSIKKAVYAGSFDPFTVGHHDIVKRALHLFDELILLVLPNHSKKSLFSIEARIRMLQAVFGQQTNIRIDTYDSLTVDYLKNHQIQFLLRGIRSVGDLEKEQHLSWNNKSINPEIDTFFLMSAPEHLAVSSSLVRELLSYRHPVYSYIPKSMQKAFDLEWSLLKC
ncbi:MAG: pantetheine-phosphate adenylyltransferase [Fibrobacter sp.]|jgi:pantetheine-phosphate adenylyltransferase|nr:pantetheine-phosphate adenylyltransferase [Fibrobacter sp.]